MALYLALAKVLVSTFKSFLETHVPRNENRMADALANFASSAPYPCHVNLNIMEYSSLSCTQVFAIQLDDGQIWMTLIFAYLVKGTFLDEKKEANKVKARVSQYCLLNDVLF